MPHPRTGRDEMVLRVLLSDTCVCIGGWGGFARPISEFELEDVSDHDDHVLSSTGLSPDSAGLAGYPATKTQFDPQLAISALPEAFHTSPIQHARPRRSVIKHGAGTAKTYFPGSASPLRGTRRDELFAHPHPKRESQSG